MLAFKFKEYFKIKIALTTTKLHINDSKDLKRINWNKDTILIFICLFLVKKNSLLNRMNLLKLRNIEMSILTIINTNF